MTRARRVGGRGIPLSRTSIALVASATLIGCTGCGAAAGPAEPSISTSAIREDWDTSAQAMDAAYEAYVDGLQAQYNLTEPVTAPFVRFVSPHEWAPTQVDCAVAKGVPARLGEQGGVEMGDVPSAQADAVNRAMADCAASYAIDPRFTQPLPRKRAELEYTFRVEQLGPCVERAGYDVSASPSMTTWLDQYYSEGHAWDPFAEVAEELSIEGGLDELYELCDPVSETVYPPLEQ